MANHDQNSTKQTDQVTVIILPFPAQSHLNQLLQLSCLISSYKIQVHYISSAVHNHQLKIRAQGFNPQHINNIIFHDLHVPQFPSPDPDPALVFPEHMIPSFEAFLHMREPVSKLLKALSSTSKRIIIIHDSACGSVVQDACSIDNAERYAFNGISAFTTFFFTCEAIGEKPSDLKVELPENEKIPSIEGCFSFEMMNFMAHQYDFQKYKDGDLYNTCRLIEGTYVDLLAKLKDNSDEKNKKKKKQWAIGPLQLHMLNICNHKKINSDQDKCLKWLDKQGPKSVIYISFGTTTTLSDEQIKELASGLEASKVKFIWVLREADRGDIFTGTARRQELPEGFEDRLEGRMGMVVREYWAPQIEILGHTSTGGFMSHCGWNSCMESISMGVPIAAWPMHSDQPQNAVLITELLKVGLIAREWECRRKLLMCSSIKNVVTRLMTTEEGKQIRERAQELGNKLRKATEEGGISHVEMDSFIAHITR